MQGKTLARLAGALVLAAAPAVAQQIPVADFARYAQIDEVALSPTGEYLALALPTPDGKETNLHIVRLADNSTVKVLRFGQESHVRDVTWTDSERITVARARRYPMEEFTRSMGQLMSTDLTGENQRTLFAYVEDSSLIRRARKKDLGWAFLESTLPREPGKALVKFYCFRSECGEDADTVIFKVDTLTGDRKEVERIRDGDVDSRLLYDHDGVARVAYSENLDGTPKMSYRSTPASAWTPVPASLAGYNISGGVFADDDNTLYALVSDKGEPAQLYQLDLAAGTRKKLAGDEHVSVDGLLTGGFNRVPFGVAYTTHKPLVQYFDSSSQWAQLHAALMKRFAGQMVYFLQFTRDDSKLLFWTSSDRVPGDYYLLDRANGNKITQIGSRMPWFEGKQLAAMRPIEFNTRDGATIYGYYTAPLNAGAGPQPLVVLPHGGPFHVADSWGFNREVQFLANRGYGVLQVNYRGSSGRGHAFVTQAFQQWGGMIQRDITDGVKYAIDAKLADPERICIYGASFGGYSALMQPILNQGLYKCAIGYVGVYDLPLELRNEERSSEDVERWYARSLGTDTEALAKDSPALRAGEIKVPVMLVHGKADSNVRLNQFKRMDAALRDAGRPAETFLAPGEGHGFSNPDNIEEFYRRMADFLDKHIGSKAAPVAASQ